LKGFLILWYISLILGSGGEPAHQGMEVILCGASDGCRISLSVLEEKGLTPRIVASPFISLSAIAGPPNPANVGIFPELSLLLLVPSTGGLLEFEPPSPVVEIRREMVGLVGSTGDLGKVGEIGV
jgi:hypothetical protein